jgi:hypothetical protein
MLRISKAEVHILVVLYVTVLSTTNKLLLQTCKLELFYINGSKCLYICSFVYFVLDQKGNQTQRLPEIFLSYILSLRANQI